MWKCEGTHCELFASVLRQHTSAYVSVRQHVGTRCELFASVLPTHYQLLIFKIQIQTSFFPYAVTQIFHRRCWWVDCASVPMPLHPTLAFTSLEAYTPARVQNRNLCSTLVFVVRSWTGLLFQVNLSRLKIVISAGLFQISTGKKKGKIKERKKNITCLPRNLACLLLESRNTFLTYTWPWKTGQQHSPSVF